MPEKFIVEQKELIVIESYFWRFKDDYIYTREFVSLEDFRKHIEWAISDYNIKRPHSSLN